MKKLVTIMIPAYNEEKSLPKLFKRLNLLAKNTSKYASVFLQELCFSLNFNRKG